MADRKANKLDILSAEDRRTLKTLSEKIKKSEKKISLLKELGVGVSDLEARLAWAKKRTDLLLEKG